MFFLSLALPLLAGGALGAQPKKLNVLFIAADDLRPTLGCYGHPLAKTPNIDALAGAGVRFERAYCQFPLCNPSRASLLTGRYPGTTTVLDNTRYFRQELPDVVTLPQHFRNNGYVTARAGKIFHGGIDDQASWDEGGQPGGPRKPRTKEQAAKYRKTSDRWVAVEGDTSKLADVRTADRAIALLEKYRDRPLFLAVGFVKPHTPLIAPEKYFSLYDAEKIELPVDFAARPKVGPGVPERALPKVNGDIFIDRDATPKEAREMIRAYLACTSFIDHEAGRVLAKLNELGLRDSTVVVFWGDHGFHLGEKGKWSKHNSLYEAGTRVPLIIAAPGMKGNGQACPRPAELLDLYPTLAELCGLPNPEGVEGHSLVPLLQNPRAEWGRPAFSMTRNGRSVRTERWRYTEWGRSGQDGAELYDHAADPHEAKNLAGDPAHAGTVAKLRTLLRGEWDRARE
ncbi:MAG TPA: sulfatase [Gemmataceae bacterium]